MIAYMISKMFASYLACTIDLQQTSNCSYLLLGCTVDIYEIYLFGLENENSSSVSRPTSNQAKINFVGRTIVVINITVVTSVGPSIKVKNYISQPQSISKQNTELFSCASLNI